jgi:FKBP-type peptidyl-prolyl cis-trans isomerase (trigger factor)
MIIEHDAEHVLEDQQRQLAQYNIDFEQYMQGIGKSTEEIFAEAKDSAELRLKRMLVVDTLAEDSGASVSDEEVAAEIALMQETPQYANENMDTDEARDAVQRILRRRTAIDQVIELIHKPKAASTKAKKSTTTKKAPASKEKKPAAKKKPATTAKATKPSKAATSAKK